MTIIDNSIHRALHHKDANGRDPEIESYVYQSVAWYSRKLGVKDEQELFFDVGADYGYAMECALNMGFKRIGGIEPFPTDLKLIDPIYKLTFEQAAKEAKIFTRNAKTHLFLNHVFEHLENPVQDLREFVKNSDVYSIFIAVPNIYNGEGVREDDWALMEGHLWAFTPTWFYKVLPRLIPGYELTAQEGVSFRNGWNEIWNLFTRRSYNVE